MQRALLARNTDCLPLQRIDLLIADKHIRAAIWRVELGKLAHFANFLII